MKAKRFLPAVVFALVLMLVPAGAALADYADPPGWDANPYFTHQTWEFFTPANPLVAEENKNPYGKPEFEQFGGVAYFEKFEGREGVWQFDDWSIVDFIVPNSENPALTKEVWFQATYWTDDGGRISEDSWIFPNPVADAVTFGQGNFEDLGDGWYRETWMGAIFPQPALEDFSIFFDGGFDESGMPIPANVYLDQVSIDTRCVPIPGAVLLLGSGLLGLVGVRRRNRS
jgi:hypothetical protein